VTVLVAIGACVRITGTEENEGGRGMWMVGVIWVEINVLMRGHQSCDVVNERKSSEASPRDESEHHESEETWTKFCKLRWSLLKSR
jgi:hypothetical protein